MNLDHVTHTKVAASKGHGSRIMLYRGTELLGVFSGDAAVLENSACPIVPASPGQYATVVSILAEDAERSEEVLVERFPIVAWRIWGDFPASAVLPVVLADNSVLLLECPDGKLHDPHNETTYDDIAEAKDSIKKAAQEQRRRKKHIDGLI